MGMGKAWERQGIHGLAFVVLGAALYGSTRLGPGGRAWGVSFDSWLVVSWLFAGLMQAWIAFFWRAELHHKTITKRLGRLGFGVFGVGFVFLAWCRFMPLIPISLASAGTLRAPRWLSVALIAVTTPFILWTFYSFAVYFGIKRTMGADHFDAAYRGRQLERRGIFRFMPNPAYTVGLLILYHAGLLWQSSPALIVAAAHHAFVWVAYFCTEQPDMRHIYRQ